MPVCIWAWELDDPRALRTTRTRTIGPHQPRMTGWRNETVSDHHHVPTPIGSDRETAITFPVTAPVHHQHDRPGACTILASNRSTTAEPLIASCNNAGDGAGSANSAHGTLSPRDIGHLRAHRPRRRGLDLPRARGSRPSLGQPPKLRDIQGQQPSRAPCAWRAGQPGVGSQVVLVRHSRRRSATRLRANRQT
jgi:hypothetical protein